VSPRASWTSNGFAGGYAHAVDARTGTMIAEEANDGVYRVLLEGLESAMALGLPLPNEEERNRRYAVAADGSRYLTSAPSLAQPATTATKDAWWREEAESYPRTIRHRPLPR
jgi:hypothetical protein